MGIFAPAVTGLKISATKSLNGMTFQVMTSQLASTGAVVNDYAYAIEHNGRFYVFQSSRGDDLIFEHMMTSLRFD